MIAPDRPHPIPGMIDNPEWSVSITRRGELYLAERARRQAPDREPARFHIAIGIVAAILIAAALVGSLT